MHSLPDFPSFGKLDITHKEILRQIASNFPTYSDFNFVSLFTWDTEGAISISLLHDNLIIKFSDYQDGSIYLTFLGSNDLEKTIDALLEYCQDQGIQTELKLIGEAVIDSLGANSRDKYVIKEDRDNHDYILSANNMSDISNFHPKKRTKINAFLRQYDGKFECKELDLDSEETHNQIRQLLRDWQLVKNRDTEEIKREFMAIDRSLNHYKELNLLGYGTYIDGELVAFTLFELVHDKTAMLHFGKTNTRHRGSNEHLQHYLAKYLKLLDVELMNNEQDLGIEGLRKSKEASLPIYFLKKYTIALKD